MNKQQKCFACNKKATKKLDDLASIVYACDLHAFELARRCPRDKIIVVTKIEKEEFMENHLIMVFLEYIFAYQKKKGNILNIHDAAGGLLKFSVRNKPHFQMFSVTHEFMEDFAVCNSVSKESLMKELFNENFS